MLQNLYSERRTKLSQAELNAIMAAHQRYATGQGGARAQLKCTDLNGLNLANRNLDEADFSGASLVGVNLYGSSLVRSSLYCADLRNCDLRKARLTHADLRGASFRGANLAYAALDHADLRAAMMMYVGQTGVSVVDRAKEAGGAFGGVDFANSSLRGASFGSAKLDGANFTGAFLHCANFRGAKLTNARFEGAVLTGVNLAELKVPPEALATCVTDVDAKAIAKAAALREKLDGHQQWIASDGKEGAPAVLDGEDLRPLHDRFVGRPLIGLSACRTIAISIDFSGSQLQGAKFDGADLRAANFTGAELSGASFKGAKLTHARFDQARLGTLCLRSGDRVLPSLVRAEATEEQFATTVLDESLALLGLPAAMANDSVLI